MDQSFFQQKLFKVSVSIVSMLYPKVTCSTPKLDTLSSFSRNIKIFRKKKEPSETSEPSQPSQPSQPNEPWDPNKRSELFENNKAAEPGEPSQSSEPRKPCDSSTCNRSEPYDSRIE